MKDAFRICSWLLCSVQLRTTNCVTKCKQNRLQYSFVRFSEGDPDRYLTYFKRGTVYFALGKAKFALNDFSMVLELKPDFTAARYQRGTVYMKLGEYDLAELDLYHVVSDYYLTPHVPDY